MQWSIVQQTEGCAFIAAAPVVRLNSLTYFLLTTYLGTYSLKWAVASSSAVRCGVVGKAVRSHSICPRRQ